MSNRKTGDREGRMANTSPSESPQESELQSLRSHLLFSTSQPERVEQKTASTSEARRKGVQRAGAPVGTPPAQALRQRLDGPPRTKLGVAPGYGLKQINKQQYGQAA